jgi:hypothetical protein
MRDLNRVSSKFSFGIIFIYKDLFLLLEIILRVWFLINLMEITQGLRVNGLNYISQCFGKLTE